MKNDKVQIMDTFEDKKIKIIEKSYFYFFIINMISSIVGKSKAAYSINEETSILYAMFGLFIGLTIVLMVTKKYVKSTSVRMHIYSLMGIIYTIQMQYLLKDKAFITLHGIVFVLYIIPSMMNRLKYIVYFSITPIVIITYYMINTKSSEIIVGRSFYFNTLLTFLMLTYLLYQNVLQNKWCECQLQEKVTTTESQNYELTALNEQYIAAEEELFNKYDELSRLNTDLGLTTKKLSTILNVTHEAFIEVNLDNFDIKFNRMAKKLFHFSEDEEIILKSVISKFVKHEQAKLRNSFDGIKNDTVNQNETEVSYIYDGCKYYYNFIMTKFIEKNVEYVLVAVEDTTFQKQEEQSLYKAAYIDKLTGLLSKQALYNEIDTKIENNEKDFAMYILDLKGMRDINSMFGFKVGDEVIKSVGLNLLRILIKDCLLTRTGGDEFSFIVHESVDPEELNDLIAEKLDRYINDDMNFRINYKLGVAYMKDSKSSMELYENAEMAMYMAKENVIEDVTVYRKEYRNEAEKSIRLSQELENALLNNEIFLHFQPKVNTDNGEIFSYESLVRWNSSELGFVSPLDFIEVAEQTGYIIKLGEFIIEESCRFAKQAILKNPKVLVSINISSVQLRKPSFESELLSIIDKHGVPRKNIGIEITETAIISNMERVREVLGNIRNAGITIFLDDFGTGYSSLLYLNILPIDVLKIDKSFIDEIGKDDKQKNLVKQIISLAKSMGLKTVAEGVEDKNQFDILKRYECEIIQGYYFYKPLSYYEALKLLDS